MAVGPFIPDEGVATQPNQSIVADVKISANAYRFTPVHPRAQITHVVRTTRTFFLTLRL